MCRSLKVPQMKDLYQPHLIILFLTLWFWIRTTPDLLAVVLFVQRGWNLLRHSHILTSTRDNLSARCVHLWVCIQAEQTGREDWCPKSRPCPDLDEGNGHAARDKAGQRRVWGAGWSASNNGVRALRPRATQRPVKPPPLALTLQ